MSDAYGFQGTIVTALAAVPAMGLYLVHDRLPGAGSHGGVAGGEVSAGDLQIQYGLAEGLVFRIQDRERLGFNPGAQAVLLVCDGVLGVKNIAAAEQDEARFHVHGMNRVPIRQQRVSALWASFNESCRMVASWEATHQFTDSFTDSGRSFLEESPTKMGFLVGSRGRTRTHFLRVSE